MSYLETLLENNRKWSERNRAQDAALFEKLARQQSPSSFWIGCCDSRVSATQLTDLQPGEMFVHRNVGNVVVHTDLNCLAALQYAVDVLSVQHVIVCGHYGCGGVHAAFENHRHGLIDNWLRHVQDVHAKYAAEIAELDGKENQIDRLCELNVVEQVAHVCQTTIVQDAWARGQSLSVHGFIFAIRDGLLHDLQISVHNAA
ncbi:MAG: carbonate dehydratase [Chloroflexota bacterium]|nr:MAG: carbonate dehydratase [Chloroflexota bacterium]